MRTRLKKPAGETELPWRLPFVYGPYGPMGGSLERTGVYDLAVTETIFRLLGPGDIALDVGANVGYMTSVMACRVGAAGHVIAFEPQPQVFARLQTNLRAWRDQGAPIGNVSVYNLGVSDTSALRALNIPHEADANSEQASFADVSGEHTSVEVQTTRLDDLSLPAETIALVKVDTEGHELEVLRGADRLLAATATLVLEEFDEPPTPVSEFLRERGFALLTVRESLAGPELEQLSSGLPHVGWGPPNIVATREPDRVRATLAPRGWYCLGTRNPLNMLLRQRYKR